MCRAGVACSGDLGPSIAPSAPGSNMPIAELPIVMPEPIVSPGSSGKLPTAAPPPHLPLPRAGHGNQRIKGHTLLVPGNVTLLLKTTR